MKNVSILSLKLFFFIFVSQKKIRECICSLIYPVLIIIGPKIILAKLLDPTNLSGAELFVSDI